MSWQEMYDLLLSNGVSQDALDLAFAVSGCSTETACAILYYYTGWDDFDAWLNQDKD